MTKYKSKNIMASFSNAIHGLKLAFFSQRNFVIEVCVAIFVFFVALFLKFSCSDIALLILMIAVILLAELVNSVFEFTLDAVYKNKYSKQVQMAKDISAGMVLLISFLSILFGGFLFYPYIFS